MKQAVLGIGGVFFTSPDPKRLAAWYREHLGLPVDGSGVALFAGRDGPSGETSTVWCPFPEGTAGFGVDGRGAMINYRVADLARMIAQLRESGIALEGGVEVSEHGRLARLRDPDGNLLELWEPARNKG